MVGEAMEKIIFDAYGRYVDLEALREEKSAPTLTGVRNPFGDHPAKGLTPTRLGHILREGEQGTADSYLELAEEMEEKDLHYAAVLSSRKRAVSGLPITVEAASDEPEDLKAAEIIEDFLTRDELREELFHILDAIAKGYSVTEIIWETDADIWTPRRLVFRDPTFFEFDRLGGELLLRTEKGPQPLDKYKYIVHKSTAKSGLAIRGGLARAAAWGYMFKNFTLKAWTMFLEVFGLPLRLGKYGQGASKEDRATLLKAVRDVASDAAAIIPDTMQLEFISATASGEGTNSFFINADYWDKQLSKLVLGQTGTTDTGQYVGTSDAHQATQFDIEVSDAVQLAATLNRDLVRPMIDLNLGPRPGRLYPKIRLAREKREDLTALVSQVTQLVPFGLEVEESVMRDRLGLPEPAKGAKLLTTPAPPGMPMDARLGFEPAMNESKAAKPSQQLQANETAPKPEPEVEPEENRSAVQSEIDSKEAASDWESLVGPAIAKIYELAESCQSHEELKEAILKLAGKGGLDLDALGEDLAGKMFAASLGGAGIR
jgi:phage gp29-like protein